jgi:hypothetical protein
MGMEPIWGRCCEKKGLQPFVANLTSFLRSYANNNFTPFSKATKDFGTTTRTSVKNAMFVARRKWTACRNFSQGALVARSVLVHPSARKQPFAVWLFLDLMVALATLPT